MDGLPSKGSANETLTLPSLTHTTLSCHPEQSSSRRLCRTRILSTGAPSGGPTTRRDILQGPGRERRDYSTRDVVGDHSKALRVYESYVSFCRRWKDTRTDLGTVKFPHCRMCLNPNLNRGLYLSDTSITSI